MRVEGSSRCDSELRKSTYMKVWEGAKVFGGQCRQRIWDESDHLFQVSFFFYWFYLISEAERQTNTVHVPPSHLKKDTHKWNVRFPSLLSGFDSFEISTGARLCVKYKKIFLAWHILEYWMSNIVFEMTYIRIAWRLSLSLGQTRESGNLNFKALNKFWLPFVPPS